MSGSARDLAGHRGRCPGSGAGRGPLTLSHVTPGEVPDAVRGAFAGLLRRTGPDPGSRLEEMAATSAGELLEAARLGRACERLEIAGRAERAVVAASARADQLIVARDGDRARLGPKSLGKTTRLVVDHELLQVVAQERDPFGVNWHGAGFAGCEGSLVPQGRT
jgi:hypothetical protein